MKIYPAIDILGGKAVRLVQGRKEDATVYGDPVEMAVKWASKGADWLHVVDLDGAFEGQPRSGHTLTEMGSHPARLRHRPSAFQVRAQTPAGAPSDRDVVALSCISGRRQDGEQIRGELEHELHGVAAGPEQLVV